MEHGRGGQYHARRPARSAVAKSPPSRCVSASVRVCTQRVRAGLHPAVRRSWRFARTGRRRDVNPGPGRRDRAGRADNPGMVKNDAIVSAFSALLRTPGLRLARARRFAALLALSLFALGGLVPGDAIARAAKERAAKARRESGWCSYY